MCGYILNTPKACKECDTQRRTPQVQFINDTLTTDTWVGQDPFVSCGFMLIMTLIIAKCDLSYLTAPVSDFAFYSIFINALEEYRGLQEVLRGRFGGEKFTTMWYQLKRII